MQIAVVSRDERGGGRDATGSAKLIHASLQRSARPPTSMDERKGCHMPCNLGRPGRVILLLLPALIAVLSTALASEAPRQILRIDGTAAADNRILVDLGFDVAAVRPGEWTEIVVSAEDLVRLQNLGYEGRIVGTMPMAIPAEYHTYGEMVTALQQMVEAHPTIARMEDIGDGWGKIYNNPNYAPHDIWALKISDNVDVDEAEPELLYSGVHHAREPV